MSEAMQTPDRSADDIASIVFDLQENGYSVVSGILTDEECFDISGDAWTWLENLGSGINRHDPKTWKGDRWPTGVGHGLIQSYSIGNSAWTWKVRSHPNVKKVFSGLWGTPDLCSSFDGVCIKRPPEMTSCRFASPTDKSSLHCDQSKATVDKVPSRNGWQCIQSGINLEACDSRDACFKILRGSHRVHAEAPWVGSCKDWYKLNSQEIDWYKEQGCVEMNITCKSKGTMVLWDSRAIHASTNPSRGRSHEDRFRFTVFVCMTPKSYLSSRTKKRRLDAFVSKRTTSHWPSKMSLFPKKPRTYGKVDKCSDPVEVLGVTSEMKSLI